jgi:two-component system chemotaxis response regulator CheY
MEQLGDALEDGRSMTSNILVVDDDANMRELLRIHLGNAGYEVCTAEDGIAAGYGVLRQRPDLIISDVNMPYLDGFEFIAAMREEVTLRTVPVIFLTTAAEGEYRGKELGAVGYLPKPVRADRLLSLVAAHVQSGRLVIG